MGPDRDEQLARTRQALINEQSDRHFIRAVERIVSRYGVCSMADNDEDTCTEEVCPYCELVCLVNKRDIGQSGLNMDAEGATAAEVVDEVKRLQNGQRNALATLCGQVNGLRERTVEADRLLQDEFGEFYESAPDNEPLGRVRDMLRNNRESSELPKFKDNDPSALGHE